MGERPSNGTSVVTRRERQIGALTFIALGILGVGIEIALHVYSTIVGFKNPNAPTYELNHAVLIVSVLFGFVGFAALDLRSALEGGGFVSNVAIDVLSVIRTGRRSTDPVVVVGQTQPAAAPSPSPEKPDGP